MKINKPTPAGALVAAVVAVVSLALVPAALAGKSNGSKPGSGTSAITGPVLVTDLNNDGLSNWGDTVTFNVSTTATTQPYVHLVCSGNSVGYDSWRGYFAGSLDTNWNFVLGSGGWTGGAADCTASVGMYTRQGSFKPLASTSFHVDA